MLNPHLKGKKKENERKKIPLVSLLLNLRMIIARAVMRTRIIVIVRMAMRTGTRNLFFFFFFFPWHETDGQRFGFAPRLAQNRM